LLELETQVILAKRIGYLTEKQAEGILKISSEVGRMLSSMSAGLRRKQLASER
jgi:hypothetical protein